MHIDASGLPFIKHLPLPASSNSVEKLRLIAQVDGGICSDADVFKALALGADAVVIARPFVPAAYGGTQEGVESYIRKIGSELADAMEMCGVNSLSETRETVYAYRVAGRNVPFVYFIR